MLFRSLFAHLSEFLSKFQAFPFPLLTITPPIKNSSSHSLRLFSSSLPTKKHHSTRSAHQQPTASSSLHSSLQSHSANAYSTPSPCTCLPECISSTIPPSPSYSLPPLTASLAGALPWSIISTLYLQIDAMMMRPRLRRGVGRRRLRVCVHTPRCS